MSSKPYPGRFFYIGGLSGLGILGFEQCLALVVGLHGLSLGHGLMFAVIYSGVGAVVVWGIGKLCAVLPVIVRPLDRDVWVFWMALCCCSTGLLMAKLVHWGLSDAGRLWGFLFVLLLCACLPVSSMLTALIPKRLCWPVAFGAATVVTSLFFVNLNLYGSPMASESLTADAWVLSMGAVLALGLTLVPPRWIPRRSFWVGVPAVLSVCLFSVGLGLPWSLFFSQPTRGQLGSPVVLIVVDTLRADHLQTYGYDRDTSPNLLAFSESALVFEQAQATAPWTLPSFASVLTGTLPSTHGAGVNTGQKNLRTRLGEALPTLPEAFSRSGARTGAVVSNVFLKRSYGLSRGFQTYDDAMTMGYYPLLKQPIELIFGRGVFGVPYRSAETMADRAIDFLEGTQGQSSFLMLHFMDPHLDYAPLAADVDAVTVEGERNPSPQYDAEIRGVDRAIGRVLAVLPESAVVVVTADHGEILGRGRYPRDHSHGHNVRQGLLRVPLMVRAPDVVAGRAREVVSLVDLAANIAAVSGVAWQGAGRLWAELRAEVGSVSVRPAVSEAVLYGAEHKAVRIGRWKASWRRRGWAPDKPPIVTLYDLQADPKETQDLTLDHLDIVRKLAKFLPTAQPVLTEQPEPTGLDIELLRSLGYLEP